MGIMVICFPGGRWAVWRGRLSSEIRVDPGDPDPLVWFVKDLEFNDLVGWFPRRFNAIAFVESEAGESLGKSKI